MTSFFSFNFSTPKVEAQTVVEIQALIQQLQSQIQSLQQQLAQIERRTPHPVTPSLNIISPTINQRIEAGTIHTISWNVRETGSRQNIQVHQRIAGGRWTHLSNLNFNTTSYNWTAPFVNQTTNVEILIGVAEDGRWIVTNIIPVQIIPTTVPITPYITVLSPNGGERWEIGKTYEIRWIFNGSATERADIVLLDAQNRRISFINEVDASQQKYTWTISSDVPVGTFRLGVEESVDVRFPLWSDSSNMSFNIVGPTIRTPSLNITSPTINQRIESGTTHNFRWNIREIGSRQNIQIHQRIAGGRWTHLTNLNFNATSYNWTVPFVNQTTNAEILIGVSEGGRWLVTNIIPVQIVPSVVPTTAPIITSISPSSGIINDWITIHGRNLISTTIRDISINSLGRNVGLTSPALRSQADGLALTFQLTSDIANHLGFGTHQIQATNHIGTSNIVNFTIIAPVAVDPVITSVSPISMRSGDWMTIHGRGLLDTIPSGILIEFLRDGRQVGAIRDPIHVQPDGLSLRFPLGFGGGEFSPGTYQLRVINDRGVSNMVNFTVIAPAAAVPTLFINSSGVTGISVTSITGHGGITNYNRPVAGGTSVNLVAPRTHGGLIFDRWSGCVLVDIGDITFTMPSNNITCTANYRLPAVTPTFNLHVNSWSLSDHVAITGVAITSNTGHNGTTSYSRSITGGASINLTAPETVAGGLKTFSNWSGCSSSTSRTINITMPSSNTTCTANYRFASWALNVLSENATGVWIGSDTGHSGTTDYQRMVFPGVNIQLRASPTAPNGRAFVRWRGCVESTNRIINLTMPSSGVTCTAVY